MHYINNVMNKESGRMERERKTIAAMVQIYCRMNHSKSSGLCRSCGLLLDYAEQRLSKCPYKEKKSVCAKCPIHCYKEPEKSEIRKVMRFSGPRMLFRRPCLAIRHFLDSLKK